MPIYEYKCHSCGRIFEEIVISDLDVIGCGCGSREIDRVMSCPAPARIVDWKPDKDKGQGFDLDDATFHPSVNEDELPWKKKERTKVYEMDFGKTEKDKLDGKVRETM